MFENYYSFYGFRQFWRDVIHAPNGKQGARCKSGQKKRRKQQRRNGNRR